MSQAVVQPLYFASRAAFRAWAVAQPRGRFERIDGEVVAMAPERLGHARMKARVLRALEDAIRAAGVLCEAMPDGVTVEVDDTTDFEPDALVNCGPPPSDDLIAAPDPVIVVEVPSPDNKHIDTGVKLTGYFRVPSIQHYLIASFKKPEIVHHKRQVDSTILTRIIASGAIILDPPGLTLQLEQIYPNEAQSHSPL